MWLKCISIKMNETLKIMGKEKKKGRFYTITVLLPEQRLLWRPLESKVVWNFQVCYLFLLSITEFLDIIVLGQTLLCPNQCFPTAFLLENKHGFLSSYSFYLNNLSSFPTFPSHSLFAFHHFSTACMYFCQMTFLYCAFSYHAFMNAMS